MQYFTDLLEHKSNNARTGAVKALKGYASDSKDAVPALIGMLDHKQRNVRETAREALAELGTAVLLELMEALESDQLQTQMNAALVIKDIGPDAEDAVPKLIEALDDADQEMRVEVIHALVSIGPAAVEALPKLRDLAENDPYVNMHSMKFTVRRAARDAIERLEGYTNRRKFSNSSE